jgi:hypothetical protein
MRTDLGFMALGQCRENRGYAELSAGELDVVTNKEKTQA